MKEVINVKLWFYIAEFLVTIVLVLLYYKFIEKKNIKKYTKNNIPTDLKLFIYTQKVNMKKTNYKKLMKIVAITNAIDIGIVILITNLFNSFILKFLVAIPTVIVIIFISYNLVGAFLKKKGLTNSES